ncbi:hypothetical protein FQR65_LT17814 [Abscondita terminalis]|nr:hypothetical protein FQR65_LT17814 [Abscondita terminalis]
MGRMVEFQVCGEMAVESGGIPMAKGSPFWPNTRRCEDGLVPFGNLHYKVLLLSSSSCREMWVKSRQRSAPLSYLPAISDGIKDTASDKTGRKAGNDVKSS